MADVGWMVDGWGWVRGSSLLLRGLLFSWKIAGVIAILLFACISVCFLKGLISKTPDRASALVIFKPDEDAGKVPFIYEKVGIL